MILRAFFRRLRGLGTCPNCGGVTYRRLCAKCIPAELSVLRHKVDRLGMRNLRLNRDLRTVSAELMQSAARAKHGRKVRR